MSWLLGHAQTAYTHHSTPVTLTTKSGAKTTLSNLAQSAIPPCRLIPFLFNGHLQTMWTAVKDPGPPIYYKRRIFDSTHSVYPGQFAIDFVVTKEEGEKAGSDDTLFERTTYYSEEEWSNVGSEDDMPMVIALHGLTGGSHEVYLRQSLKPLVDAGWAACVINSRGCAMSKITTPQLFNSRSTWDVRQTVLWLRKMFPNRPLYAMGFSLGANILTNYVGEEGEECVLKAAVACSNPWNLEICNVVLQSSWLGLEVYSKTMGTNMKGLYGRHKEQILKNERIKHETVMDCKYLFEFDRVIQAPTWGYPSEGAYYRDAQSCDALSAVRIPFLSINAEDDPISAKAAIPYEEFKQNPYTVLCATNWGGHLGSFQFGGKRWFATAAASFFMKMHEQVDYNASKAERQKANERVPDKKYPIFDPNHRRLILPTS